MHFPLAYSPSKPASSPAIILSWLLIFILIVTVIAQLIIYEKYVTIIQNYQLLASPPLGKVFAALIVVLEVMALPFLLRMGLSRLMRLASAACLVLASLSWVFLGVWFYLVHPPTIGSGLLGAMLKQVSADLVLPYSIFLLTTSLLVMWQLRYDFKITTS